jgi:molecular chaperone GrpE
MNLKNWNMGMKKKNKKNESENTTINNQTTENQESKGQLNNEQSNQEQTEKAEQTENSSDSAQLNKEQELLQKAFEFQDKYLRLSADFDNYRKRNLKEKADLIKTAGEDILINLLPVIDDFDRAMKSIEQAKDLAGVKEGINLIYNKFNEFLAQKGVKPMNAANTEFNSDLYEALTQIPVQDEAMKGKVVDEVVKGYFLYDKVIRHAKVVVGE